MMKDDLSQLLSNWQVTPPDAADFRRGVWQRIDVAGAKPGMFSLIEFIVAAFSRPRLAIAASIIAVVMGGLFGAGLASVDSADTDTYLRMANPYARVHSLP